MQNIKKTLEMTALLFGMALLFSFIAWFLGYDGFIIIGSVKIGWLNYILCPMLLCINLSLLTGFVLNLYSWKVLYFSAPMAIISGVVGPFIPITGLINGPISTLVLIIAIFVMKLGKWGYIRLGIIFVATMIYQGILSIITNVGLINSATIYEVFRFSISSIILMLLFYSIGGSYYVYSKSICIEAPECERERWRQTRKRLELVVFPGSIRDTDKGGQNSPPTEIDGIPVSHFEVWVMRSLVAVVQIIQWIFILWVCNLDNYFVDALVLTTSFICHGMIINKRKHFKPVIICTLAATAMFYVAARFTLSFEYSHFFPIVIGLILTYTVYRISYQYEKAVKERNKKVLERIEKLEDQMDSAWDKLDKM